MNMLTATDLAYLSRRDFLKFTCGGLLGLFTLPFLSRVQRDERLNSWVDGGGAKMGRCTDNNAAVFDRPSFSGRLRRMYYRDLVFPIREVTIGDEKPAHNRVWYRIDDGYIHSGKVQPVELTSNPQLALIPGGKRLAEVTVPYSDGVRDLRQQDQTSYRYYYSTIHWITGTAHDDNGQLWYKIWDDLWKKTHFAHPEHFRLLERAELTPLSADTAPDQKRIEVWLEDQVVIAYENDVPALITRASTGGNFADGDYSTQRGEFFTSRKCYTRHMASNNLAAANSFDLPGVPWVSMITKSGISFHGTFWHNDFGRPLSHGCINLSPDAARWVYRWTLPVVPLDIEDWTDEPATRVVVL